jgi:arginine utilization protein RocB
MSWNTPEKIEEVMLKMVSCTSISGTSEEKGMAKEIHSILAEMDYFKNNPDHLKLNAIPNDSLGRYFVTALVKGNSNRTVVLLNHHDIVGLSDYGAYKELALDPKALTKAINPSILPEPARKDHQSGEWLFGRGVMDMKCGGALQICLLEEASKNLESLEGNILYLSVPDEENNSAGMLGAVPFLNKLKEQESLDYQAVINSEPASFNDDGTFNVFIGAIGKLLPMFYCVGKETHASDPFGGINANLLAAEVARRLEVNAELADMADGESTMPPTNLKSKDVKELYNVSTPAAAVAYYNVFTLVRSPKEVMEKLVSIAEEAFAGALEKMCKEAEKYAAFTGSNQPSVPWQPKVYTFAQLYEMALQAHGEKFRLHINDYIHTWKVHTTIDEREFSLKVVSEVHRYCPDKEPMIVISFAPPYYPHIRNKGETEKEKKLLAMVEHLDQFAKNEYGFNFRVNRFHKGISDMSYCGLQDADDVIEMLKPNMPTWGHRYSLPLEELARLNVPVFNVGPFGRDAHKFTERLHTEFSYQTAPRLLKEAVMTMLKD